MLFGVYEKEIGPFSPDLSDPSPGGWGRISRIPRQVQKLRESQQLTGSRKMEDP